MFCDSTKKHKMMEDQSQPIENGIKKVEDLVPVEQYQTSKLEVLRNSLMHQLSELSPVTSRTGKLIFLVVIFVFLIALWNLDKILENNKRNRILAYDRMFFQKQFREIIANSTESISLHDYSEDYYFRGLAYFMISEEEKALHDFQTVVEHPDSHIAHVASSLCYSCFAFGQFGKYDEALQVVEESLNINPYSSVAFKGKGEALIGLRRFEEALVAFDQSLAIDPDNSGCLNSKATIYQILRKNDEALEIIDKILSKDMFNQGTHKNKVQILFALQKFEKVVQQIEIIESLFGTSCFYYYLKGDALAQLGKYNDALLNIENALFVNQGNLSMEVMDRLTDLRDHCQRQLQY